MTIEEKIKELCYDRKLTIPQLAEKIGMSKSFYSTLKNDSLKVSTLTKIADVLEAPVSAFFETEERNDSELIRNKLTAAEENSSNLLKSFKELEIKYENILKINSLNEQLVESARKEVAANEKIIFLTYVELHGLQLLADKHIKSSVLAAHPEIDEMKDSILLEKYIKKDPFNKEFRATMKIIEPVIKDDFEKYLTDDE